VRTDGQARYIFLMNLNSEPATVDLRGATYTDLLTSQPVAAQATLSPYGIMVLTQT